MTKNNDSFDNVDLSEERIHNSIIQIKKIVKSFELRMRGFKYSGDKGDGYIWTGEALVGDECIQNMLSLLQSYSEESNLITNKEMRTMARQKYQDDTKINSKLLISMGCPVENQSIVMQAFKDVLQNIADIIMGSRAYMTDIFGKPEKEQNDTTNML